MADWGIWENLTSWSWLSLNLAYLVYAISGLARDMLRLRILLLAATLFFIVYGLIEPIWSVVWWNLPVGFVHAWRIWILLQARRGIDLSAEAEAVRTLIYPDLDRTEFNLLWHQSEEREVTDEVLIVKDQPVEELLMILDGNVEVDVRDDFVVQLGRLRIVGEMSSVTGSNATATVRAVGTVRVRAWKKSRFENLLDEHPSIETAHLRAIGSELTRKLA
ncbi:MAG: cyclic nucleotide-binding domain-containing protein [Actinomycetota bacterium]